MDKFTKIFRDGKDVPSADMAAFFDALLAETDEGSLFELLSAWNAKGTNEDELFELASIMRGRCQKVSTKHKTFVDSVGTGGSRAKTFNISTAAAFITAGAGVAVAKHGNKAATSNSGSADVLFELGIEPSVDKDIAEKCLNEIGICFMFAPNFHRLSPTLAKVRRSLGVPTIFNNLGPLCNPANAPHQVIGVWDSSLVELTAKVLARLGTKRSWVVHGRDGLDEITLNGETLVAEVSDGKVTTFAIEPADFGHEAANIDHLGCSDAAESAAIIRSILSGENNGSAFKIAVMNSAAAIYISGAADTLKDAAEMASESIRSGNALAKLEQLAIATNG
jgi:anthranilate phosphoribosyltransferase